MTTLEELGIVVGIFAGIYTLSRGFGSNTCNASGVPASAPSGTVQTTPFAGTAPTIPVPALTNPFTVPTLQPRDFVAPINNGPPKSAKQLSCGRWYTFSQGPLGSNTCYWGSCGKYEGGVGTN